MPVEFIGELIIERPFLNKISMPISKPLTKCTAEKIVYVLRCYVFLLVEKMLMH